MLNTYIHDYPTGEMVPYLTCSYCGGVIEDVFAASATYPFDLEKFNAHLPKGMVPVLEYTQVFIAHSTEICDEMAYDRAETLWGENFFQQNLGEFILQILLHTADSDVLVKKQALLLEEDEEQDA
jgi:hypothetical protein